MENFKFNSYYGDIRDLDIPRNYHLPNKKEIDLLNRYSKSIQKAVKFYDAISGKNMRVNYAFKDDRGISILPVRFKKENFEHLLGLKYLNISASQVFKRFKKGYTPRRPLCLENYGYTFEKLAVLDKLEKITDADTLIITDLSKVGQAKTINFNRALRTEDRDLMLALKDFQVNLYSPRSLLSLASERAKEKYSHVREKDCVMVYNSEKTDRGVRTNVISTNHNVEIDLSKTTELMVAIAQQAEKEFQEENRNSLARRRKGI
ncbi:PBECR4 domain-containing protein [Lactobacillus sp.]|uniref:PBECR4 domain-containing protein n=1 Tax=Lactobacillus sp. TaxID=1591 RepID=UPI003F128E4B